jgi:hypothetical protein
VLIATILVIGLIVGMAAIRDALTAEMGDVAEAIGALDQSYIFDGISDDRMSRAVAGSAVERRHGQRPGWPGRPGFSRATMNFNFSLTPGGSEDTHIAPLRKTKSSRLGLGAGSPAPSQALRCSNVNPTLTPKTLA